MDAMEKPVCFLKVNDNEIPIFNFNDPVWNNPENYFPVEFLSVTERPFPVPEVRQDEAGNKVVHRISDDFQLLDFIIPAEQAEYVIENVQSSVGSFQPSDFIVPVNSTIQENKTVLTSTVDIGKISFIVFPSPTGVMITVKGVRYMERLCLDVLEFLNVFKFLFSEQCLRLKDDGLIYGSEKDRKRVLDLSKPGIIVFSPTLHAHWIKLYGTLHLRMVRHGGNNTKSRSVYLNTLNIELVQAVGVGSVLTKIISFQDSSVDLPEFFPILLFLYDDGTVMNRNFNLLDQLIIHSESNWHRLIGYIW